MLSQYRLPHQMPDEKIIRILHRDVFIAFKKVLLFIVLLMLPILVMLVLGDSFSALEEGSVISIISILAFSIYLLFIWLLFFFSIIDYLLDVWVITDKRIIDVRQNGFFSRTISEQMLTKVQDISSDIHGFFPTVFKYGNLTVQTAAENNKINFEEISDPEVVRDLLIRMCGSEEKNHPETAPSHETE
jgi:hypothetical protein